jgi:hypothetical protein
MGSLMSESHWHFPRAIFVPSIVPSIVRFRVGSSAPSDGWGNWFLKWLYIIMMLRETNLDIKCLFCTSYKTLGAGMPKGAHSGHPKLLLASGHAQNFIRQPRADHGSLRLSRARRMGTDNEDDKALFGRWHRQQSQSAVLIVGSRWRSTSLVLSNSDKDDGVRQLKVFDRYRS